MAEKVWMRPPDGGAPREVEATPEILVPLMVQGYSQCEPPEEVTEDVREHS
jgi:hypothetical protein